MSSLHLEIRAGSLAQFVCEFVYMGEYNMVSGSALQVVVLNVVVPRMIELRVRPIKHEYWCRQCNGKDQLIFCVMWSEPSPMDVEYTGIRASVIVIACSSR